MGGINGPQLPRVESEKSSPGGPETPVNPGRGISQLPSSSNDPHQPVYIPRSREPEVSTNRRSGISRLSPFSNSLSVRTYGPPQRIPESRLIPRRSPSNTTSTGSSSWPPPRHSTCPARRPPPSSLLDTRIPSLHSPSSQDILLHPNRDTHQLSQFTNSPTLGNYRRLPPRSVPAPQYSRNDAPSSSPEPRGMTTPTHTRETQLTLTTSLHQASSQPLQSFPPLQGISSSHHLSSQPHALATKPLLTPPPGRSPALSPTKNHLTKSSTPSAPLDSSSVKDLQLGVNELLKGFSIIVEI